MDHPFSSIPVAIEHIKAYYEQAQKDRKRISMTGLAQYLGCHRTAITYQHRRGGKIAELLAPLFVKHYESSKMCPHDGTYRRYVANDRCFHCATVQNNRKPKPKKAFATPTEDPNAAFAGADYENAYDAPNRGD